MTKHNSDEVKINSFKIRVNNHDLDVLHARAKSVDMQLTQYLRWRGMQPVGRIKKAQERKSIDQEAITVYASIRNELNRQGNNLNQIARAANLARLEGKPMDGYLRSIDEIKRINQEILNSITNLRATS